MNNYLLEIGVEELPSRFVGMAIEQLKDKAEKLLNEYKIDFEKMYVYATPRRLSLIVKNIAEKQEDSTKEVKGPSAKIAFDENNNPTKPLEGFMKSQGINQEDIIIKEFKGTQYVFANISSGGIKTTEILKNIIPDLIKNINFPKNT